MSEIKEIIEQRNKKLGGKFKEKEHKYFTKDQELTSVTTFKHEFFPFNAEEVAKRLESYPNTTKTAEEYLKEWNETAEFGTYIHNLIEDYINGKKLTEGEKFQIKHAINFIERSGMKNIATEIKIYSPETGLGGTIDWIAEDRKGRLWVIDWKTTKTITEKNAEKAQFPINHLDNAKSVGYAFQTSVYKFILDNEYQLPQKIHGILIVQLKMNKTVELYSSENGRLPYLENEVIKTIFNTTEDLAEELSDSVFNNI